MYRRSLITLAQRTIVRDPRKVIKKSATPNTLSSIKPNDSNEVANNSLRESHSTYPTETQNTQQPQPLPFSPTEQNQNSVGSMVGSYMLAGFGMGLGMVIVRIILGG